MPPRPDFYSHPLRAVRQESSVQPAPPPLYLVPSSLIVQGPSPLRDTVTPVLTAPCRGRTCPSVGGMSPRRRRGLAARRRRHLAGMGASYVIGSRVRMQPGIQDEVASFSHLSCGSEAIVSVPAGFGRRRPGDARGAVATEVPFPSPPPVRERAYFGMGPAGGDPSPLARIKTG